MIEICECLCLLEKKKHNWHLPAHFHLIISYKLTYFIKKNMYMSEQDMPWCEKFSDEICEGFQCENLIIERNEVHNIHKKEDIMYLLIEQLDFIPSHVSY